MLAIVIGLTQVSQASGAAGSAAGPLDLNPSQARETAASPRAAPEKCPGVKRALRFYVRRYNGYRAKMGAPSLDVPAALTKGCPRYALHLWQRKVEAARNAYLEWREYEYHWQAWLPAKWYRIARCETGVRWDWNSGAYQGAFGFAVSSWDAFRLDGYPSEAYLATPRQQYEVALAIWRRFGFSGWGCRNA